MNKKIEVIALVYKSIEYALSIRCQLESVEVDGWNVAVRIVGNDPTPAICDLVDDVYRDPNPKDYYIDRVYRCYNYAGKTSESDNICFVNSDMIFSENWLDNLLKNHDGVNIPCSRLVESGKMPSGQYAISKNFGRHPSEIDYDGWNKYVEGAKISKVLPGGLFMPCVFVKNRFVESGMYPEGNVGAISGDADFFNLLADKYGMKHITVHDSLVYHIQEGESDA